MALKDIVNINITRETRSVAVAAFNVPLILSPFAVISGKFTGRAKSYGGIADVAADFASSSPVYAMAAAIFSQNPCVSRVVVGRCEPGSGSAAITGTIAENLTAIQAEDDSWYGILADQALAGLIGGTSGEPGLAAWTESAKRLLFVWSDDADILDPSEDADIASALKAKNYDRSVILYHAAPSAGDDYPDSAWVGEGFPYEPGSSTWAYKTLKGIAADNITATAEGALKGKNCNWYNSVGGVSITQQGKVASGEYIDVIIGTDWMEARLREAVYAVLVNQRKLPYDDSGIAAVEGLVRGVLNDAAGKGIIQRDSIQVSVPKYADIPQADRIARHLPDVKFSALYLGAIHSVRIDGTLSI